MSAITRRKMTDLMQQRTGFVEAAAAALQNGEKDPYKSNMEKVHNLNAEIDSCKALLDEEDRKFLSAPADQAEERDKAEERGSLLKKHEPVTISTEEVHKSIYQVQRTTTLASGNLVQPTGAGSNIRDMLGNVASSITSMVTVTNLHGMGGLLEPYVISEPEAQAGKVSAQAGTARPESGDPTFGVAQISPYELNTTNFVDRNLANLSPADYYAKIYGMGMRSMLRTAGRLIVNGDGQASPDMYGMKTARNKAGANIYTTIDAKTIDENFLDDLFFAYGSDAAIGENARLQLTKADLKAIGHIRNSDKERVFKIHPDGGNPNIGTIEDSGVFVPYVIVPYLTSLSTATAGADPIPTMLYGDPTNYELGLFGDFTLRVDESIKGVERMHTILGDAMIGGNLVVDKGIVVVNLPKA